MEQRSSSFTWQPRTTIRSDQAVPKSRIALIKLYDSRKDSLLGSVIKDLSQYAARKFFVVKSSSSSNQLLLLNSSA